MDNTNETEVEESQDASTDTATEVVEGEVEESGASTEIDYEAELKREMSKKDRKIVELKRENRALKSQKEEDEGDDEEVDEDPIETAKQEIRKEFVAETVEEILSILTKNPKEQELIQYHYENTIKQTGVSRSAIQKDLQRARLIANESVYLRSGKEQEAFDASQESITNSGMGNNQDRKTVKEAPKFNARELEILKRQGIDPASVPNTK